MTAVVVCLSFVGLGAAGFWGRDEGRYVEIGHEMLHSGDWVTPRLMYVKYFEKPPLLYWVTALSFKCFGESEFAGRLPSVLGALLSLAALALLLNRRAGPGPAATGTLVLASSLLFFIMGRTLTTDMLLAGWYALAVVAAFFVVETPREEAERWLLLLAFASGAAVLTKGVIGVVLPGATLVAYCLFARKRPAASLRSWLAAVVVWAVITLPWFVLVSLRNPEFLHYFIVVQHIERFTGGSSEHLRPWWYFLPVTLAAMLPWTPFLFVRRPKETDDDERRLRLFLWLWALVVVGFFSLSSCKLVPYIQPALPALAGIIGLTLSRRLAAEGFSIGRTACWFSVAFWVLFGLGAAVYAYRQEDLPLIRVAPLAWWLVAASGLAVVAFSLWNTRRLPHGGILLPVGGTAAVWLSLSAIAANLSPELGHRDMCLEAARQIQPGDVTVLFRQYDPGFVYYTHRRSLLFGVKNELAFGMEQEPQGEWYQEGDEAFVRLMQGPRRVFCFTNDANFVRAQELVSPLYVIARAQKRLIFSNQPTPTVR